MENKCKFYVEMQFLVGKYTDLNITRFVNTNWF